MEAALKYPNVKKSKIKIPECEKKIIVIVKIMKGYSCKYSNVFN